MRAVTSWTVLLIFSLSCIFAEDCLVKISGEPKIIKDMISTQGYFCSMSVKILNKENVTDDCDRWALIYEVEGLLEKLNFVRGSLNDRNKSKLIETYRSCIEDVDHDVMDAVDAYLQTVDKNPIEILERVNDSLHKLDGFKANSGSFSTCVSYYKTHRQSSSAITGPPCVCPSPTTPTTSSATSQTSLSRYTTIYSSYTSPLAKDMTDSYPENSWGLDSSQSIHTNPSSDIMPLTTIVDHSHAYTTEPSGDLPVHSTEFTNGIHEPSYAFISLNPSQTRTDPEQVNKDTSNSYTGDMYDSVESPTVENPSLPTYTHRNGEFSAVMESDEIQETTKSEFGKESSKGSTFQNSLSVPSMELGIETSSNSVTKVRRSVANMDAISRAAVTTHGVSSLSTSANEPNLLSKSLSTNIPSSGMDLSNTEAPEPVSQGEVMGDRDVASASSYLSSTMLTTKTELSMASPVPGDQLSLSEVSHNPVLNAHKSYSILPLQKGDIANDDRQNSSSGPKDSFNPLPIIATGKHGGQIMEQQINLQRIIIVILGVLVLLLLCGFLYYMHQYRKLRRRLDISRGVDLTRNPGTVLPEERELFPV